MRYYLFFLVLCFSQNIYAFEGFGSWSSSGGIGGNYTTKLKLFQNELYSLYYDHHGDYLRKITCLKNNSEVIVNDKFSGDLVCTGNICHIHWEEHGDSLSESWELISGNLYRTGVRVTQEHTTKWQDKSLTKTNENPLLLCLRYKKY